MALGARAAAPGDRRGPLHVRAGGDRGDRGRAGLRARRGRADRPHHPRAVPPEDRIPGAGVDPARRPGGAAVRDVLRRHARPRRPPGSTAWTGAGGRTATAITRSGPSSAADQAALLKVRQAGLGLLMAASTGTRRPLAFVEDTAVEPARLAAYARRFRRDPRRQRPARRLLRPLPRSAACTSARSSTSAQPGQPELMRAVAEEVRELVLEFGGVNSSEHGDGLARSEFNRRVFGDAALCGHAGDQAALRPGEPDEPGEDRGRARR